MEKKETKLTSSWADEVDEEEHKTAEVNESQPRGNPPENEIKASKSYASAVSGKPDKAPVQEPQIRIIEPTVDEIYAALVKAGLIRTDCPEHFARSQDIIERTLYEAQHTNPRGIRCLPSKSTVTLCWQSATGCMYARIIAIILATAGGTSREEIEKIDIFDFLNMNRELIGRTGNHWFSVYAIYLNACEHMIKYSHHCKARCQIARLVGSRKFNLKGNLEKMVCDHMAMYRHPAFDGPPGRPPIPRRIREENYRERVEVFEEVAEPNDNPTEFTPIIIGDALKKADPGFQRRRHKRGGEKFEEH